MKPLELLLKEDIAKLGARGSIVRVRPGYARNYLLPNGLAVVANKENVKVLEAEKRRLAQQEKQIKSSFSQLAKELEDISCSIEAKANEEGVLFGSVNYSMIAEAFNELGFEVKANDIELEDKDRYPIKEGGIYNVLIRLHSDVTAKSKVWVVNKQEDEE